MCQGNPAKLEILKQNKRLCCNTSEHDEVHPGGLKLKRLNPCTGVTAYTVTILEAGTDCTSFMSEKSVSVLSALTKTVKLNVSDSFNYQMEEKSNLKTENRNNC